MKLAAQRPWITPLVTGLFALMAVTGILMFFHLESGLNKLAHEWLGWAMVLGVVLHLALNFGAFRRLLSQRASRWMLGLSAAVLALSFAPLGPSASQPPFVAPVQALAQAPLPALAQVAGVEVGEIRSRLQAAGLTPGSDHQSVADLVGADLRQQMLALGKALASAPAARP